MVYRIEDYPVIAHHLHIWPFPRGHFQHVALLPYRWLLHLRLRPCYCALFVPSPGSFVKGVRALFLVPRRPGQSQRSSEP